MEFVERQRLKVVPNVGDLVEYGGEIYFLAHDTECEDGYPYLLISLISGQVRFAMVDMEKVNEHCRLITRNEDLILKY